MTHEFKGPQNAGKTGPRCRRRSYNKRTVIKYRPLFNRDVTISPPPPFQQSDEGVQQRTAFRGPTTHSGAPRWGYTGIASLQDKHMNSFFIFHSCPLCFLDLWNGKSGELSSANCFIIQANKFQKSPEKQHLKRLIQAISDILCFQYFIYDWL